MKLVADKVEGGIGAPRERLAGFGDRTLRESSLGDRVSIAELAGLAELKADLAKELASGKRESWPGGQGASSRSGGDVKRYGDTNFRAPVFEFTFADGKFLLRDLLTDEETKVDLQWPPLAFAWPGRAVRLREG